MNKRVIFRNKDVFVAILAAEIPKYGKDEIKYIAYPLLTTQNPIYRIKEKGVRA